MKSLHLSGDHLAHRMLADVVWHLARTCEGPVLGLELFSQRLRAGSPHSAAPTQADEEPSSLHEQLDRFEAQIPRSAMQRHRGNKTHVAQELGLTRLGLRMKLQRLGLE